MKKPPLKTALFSLCTTEGAARYIKAFKETMKRLDASWKYAYEEMRYRLSGKN